MRNKAESQEMIIFFWNDSNVIMTFKEAFNCKVTRPNQKGFAASLRNRSKSVYPWTMLSRASRLANGIAWSQRRIAEIRAWKRVNSLVIIRIICLMNSFLHQSNIDARSQALSNLYGEKEMIVSTLSIIFFLFSSYRVHTRWIVIRDYSWSH